MSKNTNPTAALGELFVDATREVLEKSRIKAQMNRLERVMNADKVRLKNVYAEIGKMYVENTLKKNSAKFEYLYKAINHLNLRLERAQARLEMLREAHSVDECTENFRAELSSKIKQAQDSAVTAAYSVRKKAQDAAQNISKFTTDAAAKIGKNTKNDEIMAEDEKDFSALLAELEFEDEADKETQEINTILNNLDTMLREVEEESAETAEATDSVADAPAEDGESAESFDF